MKIIFPAILACLMVLMAGCSRSAPQVDTDALRTSLRDADAAWARAAGDKDVDAFTSFVAEGGSILPPNVAILSDKNAIKSWMAELMAAPGYALDWQVTAADVAKSGELGYTVGTFELSVNDANGKPVPDMGKYVTVWRMQDGEWKVVADIFNSDLPPETPTMAQ